MDTRSRDAPSVPASSDAPPPPPPPSTAETLAEPPRRRGAGSLKRKASSSLSSSTPSKRLIKERNALNIPSLHNGPCTRARQLPNKHGAAADQRAAEAGPAASAAAGDGGKAGTGAGGPIMVEEEETAPLDEPIVDPEFDLVRSRGSDVHVVPTPAGWFSWKEVHPIEKHMLASFFNRKSENRTPEVYMEIRNSIMRKFHANPQTQLGLKDLEEISIGDSDTKQEVMEFLDHWGLINFHPFLPENPDASNSDAEEEKRASLLEKLYQFETLQSCPRFFLKKVEVSTPAILPRFLPESSIAAELTGPVGPSVEYHCNSCSADCSRKRYHCQKQADFDLCTDCYNNEKFGSSMAPSDFILMEPAEVPGMSGGSWTDQETLLLLEALELFGENWNEIAEHVATKTKTQCILHFLQMPIEDPFLEAGNDADDNILDQTDGGSADRETNASEVPEEKEVGNAQGKDHTVSSPTDVSKRKDASELEVSCETGVSNASIAIDALKAAFQAVGYVPEQEELPSFAEAGNPVMALAVFLTRLVEPDAASTSFRSSLKAMSEDAPGTQLVTRHCFLLEDPPNDKKDPPALESAATDTSNGDTAKEEDQMQVSNGNDESRDCTDKNKENAVLVKHEQSPSMENNKNMSIENKGRENDKNSSIENEKAGVENEKILSTENGKTVMENNDKSPSIENEMTSVETKNQSIENEKNSSKENENNPSRKNEKSPSAESEKTLSVENGNNTPIENEKNSSVFLHDCSEKLSATMESSESILPSEAAASSTRDLGNPTLPGEQTGPSSVKDGSDFASPMVLSSVNPKDSGNLMLPGEQLDPSAVKDGSDSASPMVLSSSNPKDSGELALQREAVTSPTTEVNEFKSTGENKLDSVKDSGNLASVSMVEQITDTSVVVDTKPSSKEQESEQKAGADSTAECTETPDGDDREVSPSNNGKDNNTMGTNDDQINHSINKLKRAAVTVLSAATVKAKLLANQEEDQIRQLISFIIEKQLHKLEAKLALFTDIESVIMRMREQTERARHRLMHERAQIIAARLGLPAPARGNPLPLPTNKFAPGYGTAGSNPASIASQKAQPTRRP